MLVSTLCFDSPPMNPGLASERLAAKQHGVLSRAQALELGLADRTIARRVESGRWRAMHPGVYAPQSAPPSWHQRLMAAVLCGGPGAMASHRSSAWLWRLDGLTERPIEISVPAGRRMRGVIVHRRRPVDDPEDVSIDGIPATGIERTLLDLAAVVPVRRAGLALDDALRRGLTTLEAMRAILGTKGRPGVRSLRELMNDRDHRDLRLESRLESALLRLIRAHRLPVPVPQYDVMEGGQFVARLDFAYPSKLLGIEADGYRWHGSIERWRSDLRRENRLKLLGWTVLRFSWNDVHDRPEIVANEIRAALHASRLSQ
jgi:very-short-patch-repair endonuclease